MCTFSNDSSLATFTENGNSKSKLVWGAPRTIEAHPQWTGQLPDAEELKSPIEYYNHFIKQDLWII